MCGVRFVWTKAVIDRIVDGKVAVLHVGDDDREAIIPATALPCGAAEGSWLKVRFGNDGLEAIELDPEATSRARERVRSKLQQLRDRGRRKP